MQKNLCVKALTGLTVFGLLAGCATTREAAWSGDHPAAQAQEAQEGGEEDVLGTLANEAQAAWDARADYKQAELAVASAHPSMLPS